MLRDILAASGSAAPRVVILDNGDSANIPPTGR
jgi:hypothetical protein